MKNLTDKISRILSSTEGTWGISLHDLDDGDIWEWNEREVFTAASVIKVPIMIAAYQAFTNRTLMLDKEYTLSKDDQVGGSGVIQFLKPGTRLTFYDLLQLMIIQSDNTATNIMIDVIGHKSIQETIDKLGLEDSAFYRKLMIEPTEETKTNFISARDMKNMLKKISEGKVVSVYACEEMIKILKRQQINNSLPGKMPDPDPEIIGVEPLWQLAHKTGTINNVTHDIGIFYVGRRSFVVTVLSAGIDNSSASEVIGIIGKEIFNYLRNLQMDGEK